MIEKKIRIHAICNTCRRDVVTELDTNASTNHEIELRVEPCTQCIDEVEVDDAIKVELLINDSEREYINL